MEISKKDWKLFREKLAGWQEQYMERLNKEYIELLSSNDKNASEKFWNLEKRIKKDKKHCTDWRRMHSIAWRCKCD